MKKISFVILISLIISSCGKNEKKQSLLLGASSSSLCGKMSFYSGNINSSSVIKYKPALYAGSTAVETYLYIKSIEISTTGNEWIKVLDGPVDVRVTNGETVKIGTTSINVTPDEYHGVRLVLEPKVRFTAVYKEGGSNPETISTEQTLNKLPVDMTINSQQQSPISDTLLFTSANGYLVPFDIELGKETFLIFNFRIKWEGSDANNITDWRLSVKCRSTRFLN